MRSKQVHVVSGAPVCEVGRYQRRGELHGRLRQERRAGMRRVREENGTGRPAFGMALREHLLRVRVRGTAHPLPATRPFRGRRADRSTRRRATPLAYPLRLGQRRWSNGSDRLYSSRPWNQIQEKSSGEPQERKQDDAAGSADAAADAAGPGGARERDRYRERRWWGREGDDDRRYGARLHRD